MIKKNNFLTLAVISTILFLLISLDVSADDVDGVLDKADNAMIRFLKTLKNAMRVVIALGTLFMMYTAFTNSQKVRDYILAYILGLVVWGISESLIK